ncbi:CLUMA_CG020036, isoform A [Clunio marinus]|uniref:CLUMA_CG020036, isoform A n=1 Tax=Clunio marinus TaxID=568069 RepID=A0A1J1J5E2_9DIPT|nr:CLUMA_CG020036, isoform A [Clunio marinus]
MKNVLSLNMNPEGKSNSQIESRVLNKIFCRHEQTSNILFQVGSSLNYYLYELITVKIKKNKQKA